MMAVGIALVCAALLAESIFKRSVGYDAIEIWIAVAGCSGFALCVASLIVLAWRWLP